MVHAVAIATTECSIRRRIGPGIVMGAHDVHPTIRDPQEGIGDGRFRTCGRPEQALGPNGHLQISAKGIGDERYLPQGLGREIILTVRGPYPHKAGAPPPRRTEHALWGRARTLCQEDLS